MCLKYFDQDFTVKFTTNQLKQFLSAKNGKVYEYKIKFNQDVLIAIGVAPNGLYSNDNGCVCMGLTIRKMSPIIDYIIISWDLSVFDPDQPLSNYKYKSCQKFANSGENQKLIMKSLSNISK